MSKSAMAEKNRQRTYEIECNIGNYKQQLLLKTIRDYGGEVTERHSNHFSVKLKTTHSDHTRFMQAVADHGAEVVSH